MNQKKLLICSPSNALRGGVETIVHDLTRELPGRGWDTILALARGERFNDVEAYRNEYPNLTALEIDGTRGTRQARLESLATLIGRVKPDVVLSARIFDAYEVVANLKQRAGIPRLAITVRGFEPHYLFDAKAYRDNVDLCVVDGNLLAAACVDWCALDAKKVVSIPGGIKLPTSPLGPRHLSDIIRIGYVGRLVQNDKRILDIVPLVRLLDKGALNFDLNIVGEGPEEAELRGQLGAFVSEGRVRFHGWKTREQLYREVYPNLDCIVNFSPAEGVTISGREAMAHGVVPVMSQFVGIKSEGLYVAEHNALTFAVGDILTAAHNIIRLKNEPGLLKRLSTNAASFQTGKYTYEGAIDAWKDALNRCMERPPAIGPVPRLALPPDGRFARMGLSPRMAQLARNLMGRRHVHADAGSEWPTGSGLLTNEASNEIMRFARECEDRRGTAVSERASIELTLPA